jgi:hypothetical protein
MDRCEYVQMVDRPYRHLKKQIAVLITLCVRFIPGQKIIVSANETV